MLGNLGNAGGSSSSRECILPVLIPDCPGASTQEGRGAVGARPEEATETLGGLEQLCSGARLGELGWVSLDKRRLLQGRP